MNTTTIPKDSLKDLDLRDGDRIEGTTRGNRVTLHRVRRRCSKAVDEVVDAQSFLDKWGGRFSDLKFSENPSDPRLRYLINKHVR